MLLSQRRAAASFSSLTAASKAAPVGSTDAATVSSPADEKGKQPMAAAAVTASPTVAP